MRRDLRNINVARRPGLLSCTLHTFFGTNLPNLLPASWLTPAGFFFSFFLLTGKQQLSPCAENKPEWCSAPVSHGAAGRSAFFQHLPQQPQNPHHNLSSASSVFLLLWPTLVLVSYLPDLEWTLCLVGPSSLWRVGVTASVWLVSPDCEREAPPFYSMFCFSKAAVWYPDLWPCVLLWFVVFYESLRGFEGGCSFADITVTKVFPARLRLFSSETQQPVTFSDRASWVRVLTNWQLFFLWKCVCSTEF